MTMEKFRAYRIDRQDKKIVAGFCNLTLDDLSEGAVVIKVSHSTINYKDALAATGAGRILRKYPLVGGIDLAGTVVSSENDAFDKGQPVLVNGCGLSETVDGGYAEYARVSADSVVAIPDGMSAFEAMQIGTAGYTAALAIHRMEQNGQSPEQGAIVVTGATGGVGSVAIDTDKRHRFHRWVITIIRSCDFRVNCIFPNAQITGGPQVGATEIELTITDASVL